MIILDMIPKIQTTKTKINIWLHQAKNLLHIIRTNQQNEKTTCNIGENIHKLYVR